MTAVALQRSERSSSPEPGGQSTELPSRRHNRLQAVENTGQKRLLRERQFTNYNEDYIQFDSVELDERPYKRAKEEHVVTIPSIAASHLELETAWAVVVNAGESILDEEEDLLPADAHEQAYVQVRNIVVAKWREDVSRYLTEKEAVAAVGYAHRPYAIAAWRFLTKTGYINFGVAPPMAAKHSSRAEPPKGTVVVIGAGMAGLAAARQLDAFGYRVLIVEGHGRPGGRVYTKQLQGGSVSAAADLGGSILTGIDGNPLAVLAKQLHIPLHVIDEADVPLYHDNGQEANTALDQEVEKKWNDVLDECSKYRDAMGEVADNISLGTALETLWATMEAAPPPPQPPPVKRGRKKKVVLDSAASGGTEGTPTHAEAAALEGTSDAAAGPTAASQDAAQEAAMEGAHDVAADPTAASVHDSAIGHGAEQAVAVASTQHSADKLHNIVKAEADGSQLEPSAEHARDAPKAHAAAHHDTVKQEPGRFQGTAQNVDASDTPQALSEAGASYSMPADFQPASHSAMDEDAAHQHHAAKPAPAAESNGHIPSGVSTSDLGLVPENSAHPDTSISKGVSTDGHKADIVKAVPGLASRHEGTPPVESTAAPPIADENVAEVASIAVAAAAVAMQPKTEPDSLVAEPGSASETVAVPESIAAPSSELTDATAVKAAVQEDLREAAAPAAAESAEVKKLKRQLLDWHMANLEFANAAVLRTLSMRSWDQDDPYEIQGSHCFLPGCNLRLVKALAQGLPVLYNHVVKKVKYDQQGVTVTAGNTVITGDAVVVTASLGALKRKNIHFSPALPERKLGAIRRLGFGVLNKVVMLFERDFWGGADMFGRLAPSTKDRGKFFLFYSYTGISGGPLLAALVSGEAAEAVEKVPAGQTVGEAMAVLRGIFEPQGIQVPTPLQACCTKWGQDPLICGSYSSVGVGSQGTEDYDIMAESIGDRLFFAGEGTTRKFPATMHGAFASGLREAANVDATLSRFKHQQAVEQRKKEVAAALAVAAAERPIKQEQAHDPDFNPSRLEPGQAAVAEDEGKASGAAQLADQMSQVFDSEDFPPDAEFGCFQIVRGPPDTDFADQALLRLDVGEIKKRGAPRRSMPIFFTLSQANAQKLQDVAGGDEARVNFLTTALGLQLVGRAGLNPAQQDLLKAVLAKRQEQQPDLPLPPPPPRDTTNPHHRQHQHVHQNGGHQRPPMMQQPSRRQQQQWQSNGSQLPAWAHQPPANSQQRDWGSQAPVRYPGHKAAVGRGQSTYSAPYTQPYYAAGYSSQHLQPLQHKQQQPSWHAGMEHARPGQYARHEPGSARVQPGYHARPQQHQMPTAHEPVDPRRHLSAYKDRTGAAESPALHEQSYNGGSARQGHSQQADQQGSAQHASQQTQLQPHLQPHAPGRIQVWQTDQTKR